VVVVPSGGLFTGAPCAPCSACVACAEPAGPVGLRAEAAGVLHHERYVAGEIVGRGGQGVVVRVTDRSAPALPLVAKLGRGGTAGQRDAAGDAAGDAVLREEFAILSRLAIPGLVRAHDLARDDRTGALFFVEERIDGASLAEWLADPRSRERRLASVIAELAETLARLHEGGFVHGDLKPDHVRVDRDGRARLLDFGAALVLADTGFARPRAVSAAWAAPEILAGGDYDRRADLFSLGATIWTAVTHGAPRPNRGADGLARTLRAHAPWIRPSIAEVIAALVAEHPADRPASAEALLARLGAGRRAHAWEALRSIEVPGREAALAAILSPSGARVRGVIGGAGIGKSHLLRVARLAALLEGRRVEHVRFPEPDPARVRAVLGFVRGVTPTPRVGDAQPGWDGDALLLLDEIEQAPREIVAALAALSCRASEARGIVVVASRSARAGVEAIELGPLEDASFAQLCREHGVVDDEAIGAMARVARGVPGWLVAARRGGVLSLEALEARMVGLDEAARAALVAVARLGGAAPRRLLARLEVTSDAAAAAIATLRGAGLVRRAGDDVALAVPELASAIARLDEDGAIAARVAKLVVDPIDDGACVDARALFELARALPAEPTREALLVVAADRARAAGLRFEERDALLAVCEVPAARTSSRLLRLEPLTRDAGLAEVHAEVLRWIDVAAAKDPVLRPLALRRDAERAARRGEHVDAARTIDEAIACADALPDEPVQAYVRATKGALALYRSAWEEAGAWLSDARRRLDAVRSTRDPRDSLDPGPRHDPEESARLDHNLGVVALYGGDVHGAALAFERGLHAKRALGDLAGVRSCLLNLGIAHTRDDRFDAGRAALDEAIALARALGQEAGLAWSLAARADLELRAGREPEAERDLAEAEAMGATLPPLVAIEVGVLRADLLARAGDGNGALAALGAIDPAARRDDPALQARVELAIARARLAALPADVRGAIRAALAAHSSARRARLGHLARDAAGLVKATWAMRARRASTRPPSAARVSRTMDEALWQWIDALAAGPAGVSLEEAALELARLVLERARAERVFVRVPDANGARGVAGVWAIDVEGVPVAEAARRLSPASLDAIARAEGRSTVVLHERALRSDAGVGARVTIVRAGVAIVVEHRFVAGRFDDLVEDEARRWGSAAALLLRLRPSAHAASGAFAAPLVELAPAAPASPAAPERPAAPAPSALEATVVPTRGAVRAYPEIVGASPALAAAVARLDAAVDGDLPVLIVGETGTGKELFARALHDHGPRRARPFVGVNCAAIADAVFEAELFGHTRGAFTGADKARVGLIARAEGGTLLLDEIGELALPRQASLLRALETRTLRPVGSDDERRFDVRIVAATNRDLGAAVRDGRFRADLYYRLRVVELAIPPLRDRQGDAETLARRFLAEAAAPGRPIALSPAAARAVAAYAWPGNVRELEHAMQRLAALGLARVELEHLPRAVRAASVASVEDEDADAIREPTDERGLTVAALAACGANISQAAQRLGLTRHGLKKRMLRLGLRQARSDDDDA
jgi:DNA-binding NtrC family response regulator